MLQFFLQLHRGLLQCICCCCSVIAIDHLHEVHAAQVASGVTQLACCFQAGHGSSNGINHEVNNGDNISSFDGRYVASDYAPVTHRPSWSSSAPSAGWSTASPAASWGTSQTGPKTQNVSADQGSSGQTFLQKAKEYLPGQTGSNTGPSATDNSNPSLLDKAKHFMPGTGSSQSTEYKGQGNAGHLHEAADLPNIPAVRSFHCT